MQVTLFLSGVQIASYDGLRAFGNGDDMQVVLFAPRPLGTADQYFRVVVRQVGAGQDSFTNGQFVDIYDPDDNLIHSGLSPRHDEFQGRASSAGHQIFTGAGLVFSVDPIVPGPNDALQFGPGPNPPRGEQLPFSAFPTVVPCFVAGTLIATPAGPRAVETLAPGDMVLTRDHGAQPLRWVGRRHVPGRGPMAPVEIAAGVLGATRALRVSPQHRLLVAGARVELLFGVAEALVPALALVDGRAIRRCPVAQAEYVHLLLDRHAILLAEGVAAESLLPAMRNAAGMPGLAAALAALPPGGAPARPLLTLAEARLLRRPAAAPVPAAATARPGLPELRPVEALTA